MQKREDKHTKKFEQFCRHLNKSMDDMLERFEEFPAVREELLTVSPKKFENLLSLE